MENCTGRALSIATFDKIKGFHHGPPLPTACYRNSTMTAFIRIAALSLVLMSGGAAQAALAAPAAATNDPAAKTVEAFHAVLLDTMKHAKELGVQGRYKKLEPAVDAAFDFSAMTQAIVGPGWATISAADRKSVIDALRRTTIANYAGNFDGYNGEQFVTDPQVQDRGGQKIVSTQMTRTGNTPVSFIYKLDSSHGGWKIDDVYANGFVSQVATKRSEYAATLRSGGAAALAQKLNALADSTLKGG
jgi:phospholipid transport system substrate-binding protein